VAKARFTALARARLSPGAAAEADLLLGRYLELRQRALQAQGDLPERLRALSAQRRELLGPGAAAALFGDEEALAAAAAARLAARDDPALTPEERSRREQEAEEQLPPALRARRAEALAPVLLAEQERTLRAAGAGEAEIERLRISQVGPEAAARLGELDRQRSAWESRVADFRARAAALEGLGPAEREAGREQLLGALFSGPERLRLQALERIRAARAGR
jgi:lipase chaperone LimK